MSASGSLPVPDRNGDNDIASATLTVSGAQGHPWGAIFGLRIF